MNQLANPATQQPSPLSVLKGLYFSDANLVEVTNVEEVKDCLLSKTSSCWVDHDVLDGGWVKLFHASANSQAGLCVVGVCRAELFAQAKSLEVIYQ